MERSSYRASVRTDDAIVDDVRLRDGFAFSAVVFLAVRILLSLVAVLGVRPAFPPSPERSGLGVPATPGLHNAIDGTDRWDAAWFERIALEGYDWNIASAAFFPGYPIAIHGVATALPVGESGAALLVSNAAFLAALTIMFALTTLEFSVGLARRAVVLLACFPTSYVFMAPYSESLFLVASLLCFWWARRGRWLGAGLAGFLAAATRSLGVLIVPALLMEALGTDRKRRHWAIAASLIPSIAPALYALYWFIHSGNAMTPFEVQATWFRTLTFPLVTLGEALWLAVVGFRYQQGFYWIIDLVLTAALLLPLALRWRILPRPYLLYVVLGVVTVLSFPPPRPLFSAPRYLMVLFPVFWLMASLLTRGRYVVAVVTFTLGFVCMAALFVNWGAVG